MSFSSWLRSWNSLVTPRKGAVRSPQPRRGRKGAPPASRPRLEALEDRTVPSTFAVLNNLDSGPGSLRQAVLDANTNPGADTIVFAGSVHRITLTGGELEVTDSLTIQGPGAGKLSVSGNDASRVLDVQGGTVSVSGVTVTRGLADKHAPHIPGVGGGILNGAGASLTLAGVVLADNRAVGDAS